MSDERVSPRRDPLRIRRKSTQEFSRVLQLIRKIMEGNTEKIEKLEARVVELEGGKKRKRGRPKKAEE